MHALFHLAFPVTDLKATREFYVGILGCIEGRYAERWIDFDFFGHQVSAHLVEGEIISRGSNAVDGDSIPIPHFGAILDITNYERLQHKMEQLNVSFIVAPRIRFAGQPGEQRTMFVRDPSGNVLEFKSFADMSKVFAT